VDVLLLDKTGTITLGNRQAVEFIPVGNVSPKDLAEVAQLSSLADETPEGRSIVVLAKEKFGLRGRTVGQRPETPDGAHFIPFTAQTRMSGVDLDGLHIRKGAPDSMNNYIKEQGKSIPAELDRLVDSIARNGGTPWLFHVTGKPGESSISRISSRAGSRSAFLNYVKWVSKLS
jgi:K+-transporting ATPase ATPase B chain